MSRLASRPSAPTEGRPIDRYHWFILVFARIAGRRAPSVAGLATALRLAGLALVALALSPSPALAIDEQSDVAVGSQKALADYFADLEGDSDPNRLYAARLLKGMLTRALHTAEHAPADSLASLDARSLLVELEARLPTACRAGILHRNAVGPCADIFAMLGDPSILPTLRDLRSKELRHGVQRQLDDAIATLAALPGAPPAAEPAPAGP
jgi:hypothetical protein